MSESCTLLIVDDDPEIRAYVRRSLESLCPFVTGVREAESGRRALAIVRDGGVDGLIADVQLPGIDGLALCRALDAEGPGIIPVLLISGETARADEAHDYVAAGPGRAFLPKPFNAFQLSTAASRLFRSPENPRP